MIIYPNPYVVISKKCHQLLDTPVGRERREREGERREGERKEGGSGERGRERGEKERE